MRAELPRSRVVCKKHVVDDTGQLVRSGGYLPPAHQAAISSGGGIGRGSSWSGTSLEHPGAVRQTLCSSPCETEIRGPSLRWTCFSGHSPNHDANPEALRKRDTAGPTSIRMVYAVSALIPGKLVR